MSSTNTKRIQELDALRGLAAVAVVAYHYSHAYQSFFGFTQPQPFDFRLGYLGVQLFFIVSGFVIFMTIERTVKPLDFVYFRFSRLYPTFWMGVLVTSIGVMFTDLPAEYRRTPTEILVNLTMLQEFFNIPAVDGVYWTLTRELIFYAIILAIFACGLIRHTIPLAYGWLLLQLLANACEHWLGRFPWKIKFYLLTEYCHLFVAGIVFYKIFTNKADKACYGLLGLGLLNQFLLVENADIPSTRFEESCYVGLFFLLFWIVTKGKAQFLAWQPLIFLGSISYALYLVHQVLGYAIIRWFDQSPYSVWLGLAAATAFSVATATIITQYGEKPLMRWLRGRYQPARKPATT